MSLSRLSPESLNPSPYHIIPFIIISIIEPNLFFDTKLF